MTMPCKLVNNHTAPVRFYDVEISAGFPRPLRTKRNRACTSTIFWSRTQIRHFWQGQRRLNDWCGHQWRRYACGWSWPHKLQGQGRHRLRQRWVHRQTLQDWERSYGAKAAEPKLLWHPLYWVNDNHSAGGSQETESSLVSSASR